MIFNIYQLTFSQLAIVFDTKLNGLGVRTTDGKDILSQFQIANSADMKYLY